MKKLHPTVYRLINPMKHTLKTILITGSILAMLTPMARSATVNWDTPANILADTDISTTGTFERAYNFGIPVWVASPTINGVTFSGFAIDGATSSVTIGNTTLSATGGNLGSYAGFGSASAPFALLSTQYQDLLSQAANVAWLEMTLTLSGLTIGQTYQFQTFANESVFTGADRTGTVTGGSNTALLQYNTSVGDLEGGTGQYVIGTFTADSATQTFSYNQSGGTGSNTISGFQLRSIPEPGVASLLAASGVIGLCFFRKYRRR